MFKRLLASLLLSASTVASATTVGHVYVQTTQGVMAYAADTTGHLTVVSGSPFKTIGLAVGTNGAYFFSNGLNYIHVYSMNQTTGQIKGEVANIDTSKYAGGSLCGTTGRTFLDHTGSYIFVQHDNAPPDYNNYGNSCFGLQSFKIASTGHLTFVGAIEDGVDRRATAPFSLTMTANNQFVYGVSGSPDPETYVMYSFSRDNLGALQNAFVSQTFPAGISWHTTAVAADPYNHLAVLGYSPSNGANGNWLASFTVDSKGNIVDNTAWGTMPGLSANTSNIRMSRDGSIVAGFGSSGIELVHFNGAATPTYFTALTTNSIGYAQWDSMGHLYALANDGVLYIYATTKTSVTKTAIYAIQNVPTASALIVR